jgi:hypothetical protein
LKRSGLTQQSSLNASDWELAYDHYQEKEVDRYINEHVPAEQFQQAIAAKRKELQRQFPSLLAKNLGTRP